MSCSPFGDERVKKLRYDELKPYGTIVPLRQSFGLPSAPDFFLGLEGFNRPSPIVARSLPNVLAFSCERTSAKFL